MPFLIRYDETNNIAYGTLNGMIDHAVLRQYVLAMDKFCQSNGCKRFLNDYREAVFDFSITELFGLPDRHQQLIKSLDGDIHSFKRAILVNKKYAEKAKFFEDVANNRGQRIKIFYDEPEAIKWLSR